MTSGLSTEPRAATGAPRRPRPRCSRRRSPPERRAGRDLGAVASVRHFLHLAPQELGGALGAVSEDHLLELQVVLNADGDRDGAPLLAFRHRLVDQPAGGDVGLARRCAGGRRRRSGGRRGGRRRRGGAARRGPLRLVEGIGQLGRHQRLGETDVGLDLDRLLELLDAEIALLEADDDDDADVDVRARLDGVLVQPRRRPPGRAPASGPCARPRTSSPGTR